mmetsp:Transcript_16084/g.19533  ORF Transcript_16084/g.19533 Transcript_16084/m.19533 type:complete len:632 (-) Transcript_16084:334-2229(-)
MTKHYARVQHTFPAQEAGDLSLKEGEYILILAKDESGWWSGQNLQGKRGDFPYNYVEEVSEGEFLASTTTKSPQVEKRKRSFKVKVESIKGSLKFKVSLRSGDSETSATKSLADFRALDEKARALIPTFDKPLPPMWADNAYISDTVARGRALVLEHYCYKLSKANAQVGLYVLSKWTNPRFDAGIEESTRRQIETAAKIAPPANRNSFQVAMANVKPLVQVLYDWEATEEVELSLNEGDVIAIKTKNTGTEGWWEGETADLRYGLFPSNYIRPLREGEARAFVTGDTVVEKKPVPAPKSKTPAGKSSSREKKFEKNWALPGMHAFDALINVGYVLLESNGQSLISKEGEPKQGDEVSCTFTGYIWDCQTQTIGEFASSDLPDPGGNTGPMKFVVGAGRVVQAVEIAVTKLNVGESLRVIARPDYGYGEIGNPPLVPPNCHLVYDLTLKEVSGASIPGPPAAIASTPSPTMTAPTEGPPMPEMPPMGQFGRKASKPSAQQRDAVKAGKPKTLADAIALRAKKIADEEVVYSSAPIQSRNKRPHQNARNNQQSNLMVPKTDVVVNRDRKYSLRTLQEVVRTKSFAEFGVDPSYVEGQLTEEAFQDCFGMTSNDFLLLPRWRQMKLKKERHLF